MKQRKLANPQRELSWTIILSALLMISVIFTSNIPDGVEAFGVPISAPCAFYVIFHHPCPSCGLTRAMVAALHLDIAQSLRFNWAGVWVIIGWLVLIVWRFRRYLACRRGNLVTFESMRELWGRIGVIYTVVFTILTVGNWIYHLMA